jgi:hypothetical protein
MMIRAFELGDSLLLQQLIHRGTSFDSEASLTQDLHLLRNAILAQVLPELYPETVISTHSGRINGFAQIGHRKGNATSRLRFLAPREIVLDDPGSELIEALLRTAGRRQAQYLLADAADDTEECGFFRREGFSVYARQEIWKGVPPFSQNIQNPHGVLRPMLPADAPLAVALYCSIVPPLVHQVEGFPDSRQGWLIYEEGELVGFFHIKSGSRGLWMEPFFHPGSRQASEWIAHWLSMLEIHPPIPVCVCVRSYQEWLSPILRKFGFSQSARRAVLARRVVVSVPVAESLPLPVVEKPATQATTYHPSVAQENYDTATSNH